MTIGGELTDDQRSRLAIARGSPLSYGVRVLVSPGPNRRLVVVLGEAHLKLAHAEAIGQRLVDAFALRGVESFQARSVVAGRALIAVIHGTRVLLRALSLGWIKGSTITYARGRSTGHTALLEVTGDIPLGLHVGAVYVTLVFGASFAVLLGSVLGSAIPFFAALAAFIQPLASALNVHFLVAFAPAWVLRRRAWSWMIHPFVAIVSVRDRLMARGTVRMLAEHPGHGPALVVMGRAHVGGYEDELVMKHGFERADGTDGAHGAPRSRS